MKNFGKIISMLAIAAMLTAMFAVMPASADTVVYLTANLSDGSYEDGGYYATAVKVSAEGEHGIELSAADAAWGRCVWTFPNSFVQQYPFLYFKISNPESVMKFMLTAYLGDHPHELWEDLEGEQCVNLVELLADYETNGYTNVCPYVKENEIVHIEYMYLSNVDPDGNVYVYVPPTQEPVKKGVEGHMIRYELPAYTADHVEEDTGYSWLMSADVDVVPDADGTGFTMRRAAGSDAEKINIAWVVPDEQLAQTPYLVLEVANEGRADEGPQMCLYAYWEGVVGSFALFDGLGTKYFGANNFHGVTSYNLRYACFHDVEESLHGEDGIAIIVGLNFSKARTDGTALDDLVIKDAYLMGWEEGYEEGGQYYTDPTEPTDPTSTEPATPATQPTDKPGDTEEGKGSFPWMIVGIAAAVVVVGALAAVLIFKGKKK